MSVEELTAGLSALSIAESKPNAFEPFLKDPAAFGEEEDAPIMLRAHRFLHAEKKKDNFESMYKRALEWCTSIGVTDADVAEARSLLEKQVKDFESDPDAKFEHIIYLDSVRALNSPERRKQLCHVLTTLRNGTLGKDYHQGLSIICAFLMLFLEAPRVVAMIIKANTNPKYIPDVWKAESVMSAASGYTLHEILQADFADLHKLLTSAGVIPELYASKFWCALGIHILPFQSLVLFFDDFWKSGNIAIYRLVLKLLLRREETIRAHPTVDKILEYVRLDPVSTTADEANKIVFNLSPEVVPENENPEGKTEPEPETEESKQKAKAEQAAYDEVIARVDNVLSSWQENDKLATTRQRIIDVTLSKRIERANQDLSTEVPNCASDKPDCENREATGFYYCLTCKKHMCEDCAYSAWDGHNDDDHEVRVNEELTPEDLAQ